MGNVRVVYVRVMGPVQDMSRVHVRASHRVGTITCVFLVSGHLPNRRMRKTLSALWWATRNRYGAKNLPVFVIEPTAPALMAEAANVHSLKHVVTTAQNVLVRAKEITVRMLLANVFIVPNEIVGGFVTVVHWRSLGHH